MEINGKIYFIIVLVLGTICMGVASADLGVYKQNECVSIKTILNTSAVNISTVSYPDSTVILTNGKMGKIGNTFNYTFCNKEKKS